ncbi:hypothetical protein LSH36_103g00024 [Paralvinella palmiformis]|uniref:Inositol 2-dehydrogenase n=1 Tax=Paralvinella palmiformis TaxID=53620 RepID=A0AAD9K1E0_9ANNE|nr:hypothetical protein LSH36_103g00024 [Paralvinella palmiformis]
MGSRDDEPIGLALFGLGRAGFVHFKNVINNPRCRLKYIVDEDTTKVDALLSRYHLTDVKSLSPNSAATAYDDPCVSAVIVSSPTFTHEEIVQSALNHGQGVFCEKPVSETIQGTEACYQAAEKARRPLLCSFNRRFDPSVQGIRERVRSGEIGKVHVIKTCSRDHPLPEIQFLSTSGGMFRDCAVHDLDTVCWILGEYPNSVFVRATVHDEGIAGLNDVDTVAIVMTFPSGILALTDLSRHATYGYDQRVEVNGAEGMIMSENQVPHGIVGYTKQGIYSSVYKHSFPQRYAESYIGAIDHFFSVLQGTEPIIVKRDETIKVSILAAACEESYRTGLPVNVIYN